MRAEDTLVADLIDALVIIPETAMVEAEGIFVADMEDVTAIEILMNEDLHMIDEGQDQEKWLGEGIRFY